MYAHVFYEYVTGLTDSRVINCGLLGWIPQSPSAWRCQQGDPRLDTLLPVAGAIGLLPCPIISSQVQLSAKSKDWGREPKKQLTVWTEIVVLLASNTWQESRVSGFGLHRLRPPFLFLSNLLLRLLALLSLLGATEAVSALKRYLQQDLESDSKQPVRQGIASYHLCQVFPGHT